MRAARSTLMFGFSTYRRLGWVKNIILVIIFATVFFRGASDIYAQCTCTKRNESAYDELKRSEAAFVGEVIGRKKIDSTKDTAYGVFDVTFKVKTAWKTDLPETLTIRNFSPDKDNSDFREKESYLVYARVYEKTLSAYRGCCTRTAHLTYAARDIEEFEKRGEKPKKITKASTPGANAKPSHSLDRSPDESGCSHGLSITGYGKGLRIFN